MNNNDHHPRTPVEALDAELHLTTWLLAVPLAIVTGFVGRFFAPIGLAIGVAVTVVGIHKLIWPGRVLRVPVGRFDGAFWVSAGTVLIPLFWGQRGILW